ncbi:MAG: YicC/YloC family endoribonuclease [Hyphomicrobiaceae bacterium]
MRSSSLAASAIESEGLMALSSMTGYGRADGAAEGLAWTWEIRSVNGRGLDVRMRLPPGYDNLDAPVREAIAKRLVRGNVSVNLTVERRCANGSVRLNEGLLNDILKAAERVAELTGGARPSPAELLAMKGVLETVEGGLDDVQQRAVRERALVSSFEEAASKLLEARRSEGARIQNVLSEQVSQIETLAADVRASPSRTPEAIRARLREVISRLVDSSSNFDSERLHQEAVLAATRADVEEELARLNAHVAAAREIMSEQGAVGRKLDFLAQEFNREANTLCSKANAVDVTRLGLSLKSVIDQLREQVQNVE